MAILTGKQHLFIALYYAYAWRVNHVMHINKILGSISSACDNITYRTEGTDGVVYFWQKFQVLRVFFGDDFSPMSRWYCCVDHADDRNMTDKVKVAVRLRPFSRRGT